MRHLPELATEHARYLEHNNEVDDPDYREFLARLWVHVRQRVAQGASGLDYGAGPGPALVAMMREDGFEADGYDPIFAPDTELLERTYDFIVCTETADNLDAFENWHYRRDPTHVAFYSAGTMTWIAGHMGCQLELPAKNVAIFRKPSVAG